MQNVELKGLIIFDHDGTLVNTETSSYKAYSGIKELLVCLRKHHFEIAVWTARGHKSTVESLKSTGIAQYIGEIFGHDDGIPKPHIYGLEQLSGGFTKDKIIHIGDSMGDLVGASNFGIPGVLALWNDPSSEEQLKKYTKFIAYEVNDCKKIIETHFKIKLD